MHAPLTPKNGEPRWRTMSLTKQNVFLSCLAATTLLTLGPIGCSSGDEDDICEDIVATRTDSDADFSDYETFAVAELPGDGSGLGGASADLPEDIQVNLEVASEAAVANLEDFGLTEVELDEDPDLLVFSAAATEVETGIYWACVGGWEWWGWSYVWDPCAWLAPIDFEYTEGSLLVGVADATTEEPVFGGLVQGILECSTSESALEDRITLAVDEIFDSYPGD